MTIPSLSSPAVNMKFPSKHPLRSLLNLMLPHSVMEITANRVEDGLLYADAEYSFLSNSRSQAAIPPFSCSLRAPSPDTICSEAS